MSNNILSIIRNKNIPTSEIMKVVAGNVRAMRSGLNISQKDFASRVGKHFRRTDVLNPQEKFHWAD